MRVDPCTRGFTLIELMMALALFAILVALAGPLYSDFMGNSQIRNAAENTLTGLRLAQADAVHNNRATKFVLDTTPAGGWSVYSYDDEITDFAVAASNSYRWTDGAPKTTVVSASGATVVTFDGLGRIVPNGYPQIADGTASVTQIDITNSTVATPRPLRILVAAGLTGTRLCDPAVGIGDPRSCS